MKKLTNIDTDAEDDTQYIFPYCVIGIIFLTLLYWATITCIFESHERGIFGDMFGALNVFFTGCALAGVYFNLRNQEKEIRLQKDDLDATKTDIQTQRKIDIFFKRLDLHLMLRDKIRCPPSVGSNADGINALRKMYAKLKLQIGGFKLSNVNPSNATLENKLDEFTKNINDETGIIGDGYYHSIISLLEFIDQCPEDIRPALSQTIRQCVTNEEVVIIEALAYQINEPKEIALLKTYSLFFSDSKISLIRSLMEATGHQKR